MHFQSSEALSSRSGKLAKAGIGGCHSGVASVQFKQCLPQGY